MVAIFLNDLRHVRGNAIALLVCMGLVIMPSLYAWFNIAGGWDPYENTAQVKVALANSDEGTSGGIVPFSVNVGERVVTSLTGSEKIGYVVTTEDDAVEGVRSGEYYAAVVIPKSFSANLLSVFSVSPTHPQLEYYVNEKRNAIATIVTGKASGSVQNMVDEGFTKVVTEVVTDLFDEVLSLLDDEGTLSLATGLGSVLKNSASSIDRSAKDMAAYASTVALIRNVMSSSSSLFGDGSSTLSTTDLLYESADGVRLFDDAAQTAKESASSAIDAGAGVMKDVETAIDDAFVTADGKVDELVTALQKAGDVARERKDQLQTFLDLLNALNGQVIDLQKDLEIGSLDIKVVYTVVNDLTDLITRVTNALAYMDDLIDTCDKTVEDLQTSKTDASTAHQKLLNVAESAREQVESARKSYDDNLSGSLDHVAGVIDNAANEAEVISTSVRDVVGKVNPLMDDVSEDLGSLEESLMTVSKKLGKASKHLSKIQKKMKKAVSSRDVKLVRTILGSDAASLVSFFSAPVELDREAFYPVENNGSAMTPYYTTMALWVGGTLMGVLLYVGVSKKVLERIGAKPRHAYFGRLAFFLLLGACQSTILLLGDVYFLGVQCENPLLFLLTGWLASTVFINIIYSLATSFGDVGKAIAVFVMVLQVAGSGGTFPVEMLPKVFQMAYPFLPFVHSENAMRAAMFGVYGGDWMREMGMLAAFLVPVLLLGLVLRKPLVRVNEWIEEKMEETKLM